MSEVNLKNARILLVDDFEIVRVMLKNTLIDLGFTDVDDAEDGRTALVKMIEAHDAGVPYSLVFCDWNMPEMTGIDVLGIVRGKPELANTPIVMVTAESEQESVVRAIRAGATDYIVKPIAPDVLERKLNKILSKLPGRVA